MTFIWKLEFDFNRLFRENYCSCNILCILAHIPLFLYPFLHTVSKSRPFEYLRLTSLGVVGALVKVYTNRYSKGYVSSQSSL